MIPAVWGEGRDRDHRCSVTAWDQRPCPPRAAARPRSPGGAGGQGPPAGRGTAGGKPSSVPPGASRAAGLPPGGDGHPSTPTVTRRLQRSTRVPPDEQPVDVNIRTLLDLAPGGVYLAGRSPGRRWALTPPFHLRRHRWRLCISVALSLRFPSPGVARRPALRSSDFPRPARPVATICPPPRAMLGQAAHGLRRMSPLDMTEAGTPGYGRLFRASIPGGGQGVTRLLIRCCPAAQVTDFLEMGMVDPRPPFTTAERRPRRECVATPQCPALPRRCKLSSVTPPSAKTLLISSSLSSPITPAPAADRNSAGCRRDQRNRSKQ